MTDTQPRSITDLIAGGAIKAPANRLGKEEKELLAESGAIITVDEVRYGMDEKNGGYWSVIGTVDGEPVQFNIGEHPRRDPFMQSLSIALGDGPITGLRLTAYPGQAGNKFISLEPAS